MSEFSEPRPPGAGKSSFDLIDTRKLFGHLDIPEGSTFLDLGCGSGAYSVFAAGLVGIRGQVIAVDLWDEGIASLQRRMSELGIANIRTIIADIGKPLPQLADDSIDLCFMATVLHDLVEAGTSEGALREIRRIVAPRGHLAIVEFKKTEGPPGPPLKIRLSPEELADIVKPYGFTGQGVFELGPHNYLAIFGFAES